MESLMPPSPAPSTEGFSGSRQTGQAASNNTVQPQQLMPYQDGFYDYLQPTMGYHTPGREDGLMAYNAASGLLCPAEPLLVSSAYRYLNQNFATKALPENQYFGGSGDTASMTYGSPPQTTYLSPQMQHLYTPERSPGPLTQSNEVLTTRSGRQVAKRPAESSPLTAKSAKGARKAKKPKQRNEGVRLVQPLSEIAISYPSVVVFDIETFVNRSKEDRQEESSKSKKIKRPLNAFILYRKAYQKVAMAYCGTNLNQSASEFCGESWRDLEPEALRKQFKQWADIEVRKHKEAHPAYKYVPKKGDGEVDKELEANGDGEYIDKKTSRSTRRAREQTQELQQPQYGLDLQETTNNLYNLQTAPHYDASFQSSLALPQLQWTESTSQAPSFLEPYVPTEAAIGTTNPGGANDQATDGLMDPSWLSQNPADIMQRIDPQLLPSAYDSEWNLDQTPGLFDSLGPDQHFGTVVPDLGADGAHNTFLTGQAQDWGIQEANDNRIGEGISFEDLLNMEKAE